MHIYDFMNAFTVPDNIKSEILLLIVNYNTSMFYRDNFCTVDRLRKQG